LARYRSSACRLCRREGLKLFLKGARCYGEKCAIERRSYAPGQHGRRRRRTRQNEYGLQLREKQKTKRAYGVLERQFRKYFRQADRFKGITGEALLTTLERRLDNVLYALGFGASRFHARQLIGHGHVLVNGRRINVPSYLVSEGDVVVLKEKTQKNPSVADAMAIGRDVPAWLEVHREEGKGVVKRLPVREDVVLPVAEQYIVEHYSAR
jgi:small subunit ribosomal protein S4